MTISIEQIEHIANLARLELTDEELARYREQISTILAHFEQLQSVDTDAIPPTTSIAAGKSTLRPDQSHPGLTLRELLRNAPETEERLFSVPPIFE